MALIKSLITDQGFFCEAGYAVVEVVECVKGGKAHAIVSIFKNKAARDTNLAAIKNVNVYFAYDMNQDDNIFAQAYVAAQVCPELSGSIDA